MAIISAFADEIAPDLKTQMDVLEKLDVHCIDIRGIDNVNVSKFTLAQAKDYRKQFDDRRFHMPCVGSPVGKIRIDEPFGPHRDLLKHCCDIAHVFSAKYIRIFSFYGPEGGDIMDHRGKVMDHMAALIEIARNAGIVLLHENEAKIYGCFPDGVKDLFATLGCENFQGIFDPGNFITDGVAPYDQAWTQGLAELTTYFHIKDRVQGAPACCPAGEGQGQVEEILADAHKRGFSGYLTVEPHMKAAGQFSGFTGPDLFAKAVEGLRKICDKVGMPLK